MFDGEEGSRGLRFFTFGYDVYSPDTVLVTHDYHTHQSNPVVHTWGRTRHGAITEEKLVFRADIEKERQKVSTKGTKRVNMLLGIGKLNPSNNAERIEIEQIRKSRYGVGNKRTLVQASKFSGIDLAAKKMVENKCGNLIWVPYEESPDYGVEETLSRSLVGDSADGSVADADVLPKKAAAGAPGIRGAEAEAARRAKANAQAATPVAHEVNVAPTLPETSGTASAPVKAFSPAVGRAAPRRAAFAKEGSDGSVSLRLLTFAVSVSIILFCIVGRLYRHKAGKNARHRH